MNKFAIVVLTAAMTLGSTAAIAASSSNNGSANAAANAGAKAPDAKENIQPNGVDNSKINTSHHPEHTMSADQVHKNSLCKDDRCPDTNKKVGNDVNTKTDGTTQ